jgi:hypothetical protein
MSLPGEVLDAIYRGNFARYAGDTPRPLDVGQAIAECERIARIAEALSGTPGGETEAGAVAERLAAQD